MKKFAKPTYVVFFCFTSELQNGGVFGTEHLVRISGISFSPVLSVSDVKTADGKIKGHGMPSRDDKREITNGVLNYVDIWAPLTFISYWQWHSNIAHRGQHALCHEDVIEYGHFSIASSGLAHMNYFIKPARAWFIIGRHGSPLVSTCDGSQIKPRP